MTKITICGDFTTCGQGMNSVRNGTAIHSDIANVIRDSDYSIVNLECPVADDTDKKIPKSGPNLRTTPEAISYLKRCGFTHVTLANNHFYDYGDDGVSKTIETLQKEGIGYVGGGRNSEEIHKPLYLDTNDGRIAILNYCEHEFSVHEPMGSNPMNPIAVYYDIIDAKKNCDYIIIICHGGHEGYQLPSPRMKELYRFFIDLGADIVCNHHQHCFSGWEEYHGGKIYYGLGNFFFDSHRPKRKHHIKWNQGYFLSLTVFNTIFNIELIPYIQCLGQDKCTRSTTPEEMKIFHEKAELLNTIIGDDKQLKLSFETWSKSQKEYILMWFAPYSNKLLVELGKRHLLPRFISEIRQLQLYNAFHCESIRDQILSILK